MIFYRCTLALIQPQWLTGRKTPSYWHRCTFSGTQTPFWSSGRPWHWRNSHVLRLWLFSGATHGLGNVVMGLPCCVCLLPVQLPVFVCFWPQPCWITFFPIVRLSASCSDNFVRLSMSCSVCTCWQICSSLYVLRSLCACWQLSLIVRLCTSCAVSVPVDNFLRLSISLRLAQSLYLLTTFFDCPSVSLAQSLYLLTTFSDCLSVYVLLSRCTCLSQVCVRATCRTYLCACLVFVCAVFCLCAARLFLGRAFSLCLYLSVTWYVFVLVSVIFFVIVLVSVRVFALI